MKVSNDSTASFSSKIVTLGIVSCYIFLKGSRISERYFISLNQCDEGCINSPSCFHISGACTLKGVSTNSVEVMALKAVLSHNFIREVCWLCNTITMVSSVQTFIALTNSLLLKKAAEILFSSCCFFS